MPSRVCTAVTRGVMGLSRSRRDVDALNSNIKVFLAVPVTSSPPFAHARLDRKAISHRISRRAAEPPSFSCDSFAHPAQGLLCKLAASFPSRLCFFFLSLSSTRAHTVAPSCFACEGVERDLVVRRHRKTFGRKGLGPSHNKSRKEAGRV